MAEVTYSKLCKCCKGLFSLSRNDKPPPKRLKIEEWSDLRRDPENIPKQDWLCQHCLSLLDSTFQENVLQRITDHLKDKKIRRHRILSAVYLHNTKPLDATWSHVKMDDWAKQSCIEWLQFHSKCWLFKRKHQEVLDWEYFCRYRSQTKQQQHLE